MSLISHIGNEDPVVLDGKLTNGKEALEIVRKNGVIYAARLKNELAQYYVPGKNLLYWLETKGKASNRPDLPPPPEVVHQKDEVKVKEVRFTPPKIVPKKEKEVDSIPPPRITEIRFNSTKSDLDKTKDGRIMLIDGVRIASKKGIQTDRKTVV